MVAFSVRLSVSVLQCLQAAFEICLMLLIMLSCVGEIVAGRPLALRVVIIQLKQLIKKEKGQQRY